MVEEHSTAIPEPINPNPKLVVPPGISFVVPTMRTELVLDMQRNRFPREETRQQMPPPNQIQMIESTVSAFLHPDVINSIKAKLLFKDDT